MQGCSLLSLATAVPPHLLEQSLARDVARKAFVRKDLFDRLSGVFPNAAIATRHLVAPAAWYEEPRGWAERNALYLGAADELFERAALAAIEQAGLSPCEIDGVVSVSTTGIATPSLEARTASRIGLRAGVRRVPIFGLGCAGGVSGLGLAARLALAEPGTNWLFVTLETCSISIRLDSDDPAAIIAAALFGDGCAAAVVRAGEGGLAQLRGSAEKLWPDTLGIMGWRVEDPGMGVVFDRAIPPFVQAQLKSAVEEISNDIGIAPDTVSRFCCHPGGVKVIEAIETALDLNAGELDLERDILREFGNMSAPTVLFVLQRLLERGLPDRVMMTALGPGFTCAGLLVERA